MVVVVVVGAVVVAVVVVDALVVVVDAVVVVVLDAMELRQPHASHMLSSGTGLSGGSGMSALPP